MTLLSLDDRMRVASMSVTDLKAEIARTNQQLKHERKKAYSHGDWAPVNRLEEWGKALATELSARGSEDTEL